MQKATFSGELFQESCLSLLLCYLVLRPLSVFPLRIVLKIPEIFEQSSVLHSMGQNFKERDTSGFLIMEVINGFSPT